MTKKIKEAYVNSMVDNYGNLPSEKVLKVVMTDGGLVSMQIMLASKSKGFDTVPIGRFDEIKFVEEFNIPQNLKPVMLISLGGRY